MKVIYVDWLDIQIRLFTDRESYIAVAEKKEIPVYKISPCTNAFYQYAEATTGDVWFLACFLRDEIEYPTVVHEMSHLTDQIFEFTGIEPCSEVRAYLLSYLVKEAIRLLSEGDDK